MARCVFIVQGEGRGHFSQAVALAEYLEKAGHRVEAVFTGCNEVHPIPAYYRETFGDRLQCHANPYFLQTPNKKGIYIGRTLLYNSARFYLYMGEVRRIRREITRLHPDVVFNFYDLVGAIALKRIPGGIRRIGVGHHFFLHLDGYRCGEGNRMHREYLKLMTGVIMRSCDRVCALSFAERPGSERITVVPPLVRKQFRAARFEPGSSVLVYLLSEGFAAELLTLAREDPGFQADVFSELPADTPVPEGIRLHPLSDRTFREKMSSCRMLVTTSGFDTVAEAAYMGVPLGVIPVRNHYEQRCNSRDMERSGLGVVLDEITAESLQTIRNGDRTVYRAWVDRAGKMIMEQMER
jgi:uncharacterized protein (TIGR00661 family)